MQARSQQGVFAFADGFAEAQDDGFFLRADVKNPELKKATTISAITILTIAKLLRNASASACEPASCISGHGLVRVV